ncbi:apolipoprotein N-acyltransferase [bacterium]
MSFIKLPKKESLKTLANLALYLSGAALFVLAFPKFNYFPLAWIALAPIMYAIWNESSAKSAVFKSTFAGFVIYLALLYWMIPMCLNAKTDIYIAILLWGILSLYLSIYFSIWSLVVFAFREKYNSILYGILICSLWVMLEYLRNYFLTGFPWALLGYSQWKNYLFIQISEFTGVYGISFYLVFISFILALMLKQWVVNKKVNKKLKIILVLLIGLNYLYGMFMVWNNKSIVNDKVKISTVILQGNIDQYKKFDNNFKKSIERRYSDLTMQSLAFKPDLIVWPETSYPGIYPDDLETLGWLKKVVRNTNAHHMIGVISRQKKSYYNSVILVDQSGEQKRIYNKNHLVLFGEVFPFKKFVARFIPTANSLGGITKGESIEIFKISKLNTTPNVCFETLFPNEIREHVIRGGQVICNLSNDAWYLNTSAPWHLLSHNIFRAVETRRMVVRAANTGISAFIDHNGKIISSLPLFKTGVLHRVISPIRKITFYTYNGDIFAFLCIIFAILYILIDKRRRIYRAIRYRM